MNEYKRYQEGLIKSLLAQPEKIVDIIEYIDEKDFNDVNYQMVYSAMLELYLEKRPIALPEIALAIGEAGGAIDTAWLFNLENNISQWVQVASPETWAKLLKKESVKFKAHQIIATGAKEISAKEKNPLSVIDDITTNLAQASLEATSLSDFDIKDAVERFEEQTKELMRTGGRVASVSSAYPTIDAYTGGWGATHLITIGARTGVGKSVFAINNAVTALQQGKTVMFFSLEMSEREVMSRMVASLTMIPIQTIEKALPLSDDEIQRQAEALEFIKNSNLIIDTTPEITADEIKRRAIRQSQSEKGLDMIIIDYLQLISVDSNKKSRQEAVASVSRSMKILAKELNIPVMVLVQLNRERRDEEDQTPKLYDIRESGAIAQDSNVVILIDRRVSDDDEAIDPKATFIIAKNRQGESNKYITVRARLESSLFIDDNVKGQQLIANMEEAASREGDYEFNEDSEAYKEAYSQFDDLNVTSDDFAELFASSEEDDIFGGEF